MNCIKTGLIFFSLFLIYITPAFTQSPASLQGRVTSEVGEKVEFYTVTLQSAADSSVVAVETFSDTVFRFGGIKPQTYILRIRDVRYQPFDTLITAVEGENVLKTPLVLAPATLGEVVIKSSRPVLSYNHGNLTVDVANSYLKDEASLENILGKLPGVIVDHNGAISMFGKDKLRIYINGMEARSQEEIKSLQPLDIEKIEVIRNAGAEYDADIDAVIRIKTRRKRNENIFVSLNDNLSLRHYPSNGVNLSLYLGHNEKISQYFTYSNSAGKKREHSRSSIYTYFDDYRDCNFRSDNYIINRAGNYLFYSLNYAIDKNKELGVQYSGSFVGGTTDRNGIRLIYHDEELNETVNFSGREAVKYHSSTVNLNYKQKFNDMGELSVIADYAVRNTYDTDNITEASADRSLNNLIHTDNDGTVISVTPEYKIAGKKYSGSMGLKYSYLNSHSRVEFRSSPDDSRVSEHTTGAYMTFDANLSPVEIKSGLRLEYTGSAIRYEDALNNLTRSYLNLFPYLSVSGKVNKHFSLTAYYRQTISRPSISLLNSNVQYRDSLNYVIGNPDLKPAVTDAFNLNMNYRGFDLSLGYRIYKDKTYGEQFSDSLNPNITIQTSKNMKENSKVLTAELSYSFNHPVFGSMTSITCDKYNLSLLFNNEVIRFNRPRYSINHSGNLKFLKNTSLNYSFRYVSPSDREYVRLKSYCDLSADITRHLLDKKLMISLKVHDILNTYRKVNRHTSYSNNILHVQDDDKPDTRYVTITVRYNWGKSKNIQQKKSDTDQINRL